MQKSPRVDGLRTRGIGPAGAASTFATINTLWAIEVKRGLAAKPKRGFSIACEDLSPSRAFIVYSGEARYPVAAGVEALGVREMAGLLARSSPQAPDKVSPSPP